MTQDVMLCGSHLHQTLPDVHTTLYLNTVRKGERNKKGGKGRDRERERQYIYYTKKLTENLRL
jgi:hypothetical protein